MSVFSLSTDRGHIVIQIIISRDVLYGKKGLGSNFPQKKKKTIYFIVKENQINDSGITLIISNRERAKIH